MIPPWGVPASVLNSFFLNMNPDLSQRSSILLSVGTLSISHLWDMLSKHPLMSPSSIHFAQVFLDSI
jgi:hypothetical protein